MFFFFAKSPELTAASAFKEAVKTDGLTYTEVAKRTEVTRTTLAKFASGRPLSHNLLKSLVRVFSPAAGNKIVVGQLRDELRRGGQNPDDFTIVKHEEYGGVLTSVLLSIASNPHRMNELIDLTMRWQREDILPQSSSGVMKSGGDVQAGETFPKPKVAEKTGVISTSNESVRDQGREID